MRTQFSRFAGFCAQGLGHPFAFCTALTLTVVWLICGPLTGFSNGWQLLYNTVTTLTTGLAVFLIQNATNTGDAATHLKLDALLEADAKDDDRRFIGIEDLTEPELRELRQIMRNELAEMRTRRDR